MPELDDATPFGAVAEIYHEARPPTPTETVAWLTEGDDLRDVLDLAAGTGRFTELLISRQPWIPRVHAVEPDRRMLIELEKRCPAALAQLGRAEAIPLTDNSIDAIFAAGAWQWFDQPAALEECARVLRPGGLLCVVWNERDTRVPWVQGLENLLPHKDWHGDPPGVMTVPNGGALELPERHEQTWTWSVKPAALIASLGTYSTLLSLSGNDAKRLLVAVECYVDDVLDSPSFIEVPMRTVAYRTRLAGP